VDVFLKDLSTGITTRVSTNDAGGQGNGASTTPLGSTVSADGRYVAFVSTASNLVSGDTNGIQDVFLKDVQTGAIIRASTDSAGVEQNASPGNSIALSQDGRYVAFISSATNLVSDDTNGKADAFVKDTATGTTTRVSSSSSGQQANNDSSAVSLSADGRYLALGTNATNLTPSTAYNANVFVKDLLTGNVTDVTTRTTPFATCTQPVISADGQYVAFSSSTPLVPADTSSNTDVYLSAVPY
jgi:Tol biopolymer transport system component